MDDLKEYKELEAKKLKFQEMIVDIYNVHPPIAYDLMKIIERIAETAKDEYERGKYDATN